MCRFSFCLKEVGAPYERSIDQNLHVYKTFNFRSYFLSLLVQRDDCNKAINQHTLHFCSYLMLWQTYLRTISFNILWSPHAITCTQNNCLNRTILFLFVFCVENSQSFEHINFMLFLGIHSRIIFFLFTNVQNKFFNIILKWYKQFLKSCPHKIMYLRYTCVLPKLAYTINIYI